MQEILYEKVEIFISEGNQEILKNYLIHQRSLISQRFTEDSDQNKIVK